VKLNTRCLYLATLALLIVAAMSFNTSCQSSSAQESQGSGNNNSSSSSTTTNTAIWYGGSNLGSLTTTPTSIIQPAPQITQAGSYMFIGNLSVQETSGGYPKVTCVVEVGSTDLLPSITGVEASQQGNVTATGAITLTSNQVPVTASLMCNDNGNGTAEVTQASLSIIPVGTLQTGP
jgi:uncharacterized Zn-binding protein involved in type VI secretion